MLGRRLIARVLAAAVALFAVAVLAGPAAARSAAYVPMGDGTAQVIDVATGTVVATISDPSLGSSFGPFSYKSSYVAGSFSGATAYIGSTYSQDNGNSTVNTHSTVTVISTASNAVKGVIDAGGASNLPNALTSAVAATLDGSKIYVANGSAVVVASGATFQVINQITTSASLLALSPDGQILYAIDGFDGTVSVISTATDTVTASFSTGADPTDAVLSPDGGTLFIANTNGVFGISTADHSALQVNNSGFELNNLAISPDGSMLYMTGFNSSGSTIFATRIADNTEIATVTIPFSSFQFFSGLAVTPDGSQLYVFDTSFFSTTQTNINVYSTANSGLSQTSTIVNSGNASIFGDFITAIQPVPTLTEWALLMLGAGLAGVGALAATRRRGRSLARL